MLEKCVLTMLELNWNKRLGHDKTKLNICHHTLALFKLLQNRSFHVLEITRTSTKCKKSAKIMFFIVKYANLWGFYCRRRCGCLSSLITRRKRIVALATVRTFNTKSFSLNRSLESCCTTKTKRNGRKVS